MDTERWQEAHTLLSEVLDLPAEKRAAYLDEQCAGDPELREEVESLLEAHEEADSSVEEEPASRAPKDPLVGEEVDDFRIHGVLGRGGMGTVYEAEDTALSRTVALKRINPDMARDASFLRRFRSEARALARIDSPYIVRIYALRQTDEGLFIVMEYVEGGTLADPLKKGPMDVAEATRIFKQMLRALADAHKADIIHRDIKPQNIMLAEDGRVKVTDFGLARMEQRGTQATVTQAMAGTLNYMSPEQVKNPAEVDHRSDLYSLGVTFYEMLAGRLPFDEDSSDFDRMQAIVGKEFPPPDTYRPELDDALSEFVMKAIAKDPDDRFQSAEAMLEALEAFEEKRADGTSSSTPPLDPEPEEVPSANSSSRGRSMVIAGVTALALLIAGAALWLRGGDSSPTTTRLSVSTEPPGATVSLNGARVGPTPLSDTSVEGRTAQIQVQQAGYVPLDTTVQLTGTEVDLEFALTREATPLSIETEPVAQLSLDGEEVGSTPFSRDLRRDSVRVHVEREGYQPVDTLVALAQAEQAALDLQLDRLPSQQPLEEAPTDERAEDESPAYGFLTLNASPSGMVYVDGQQRGVGESFQVTAGEAHQVHIEHPQYGACDRTLTIEEGASTELTCYFQHEVGVRTASPSDPFVQVFIGGENTGRQTPLDTTLATDETYVVSGRIQRGAFTVDGGSYIQRGGESNSLLGQREFTGGGVTISLQPSFEPMIHGITFEISESEP